MSALPTVGTHLAGLGPEEALSSLGTRVTSLLPVLASLGMRLITSAAAFGGIAPDTNQRRQSRISPPTSFIGAFVGGLLKEQFAGTIRLYP